MCVSFYIHRHHCSPKMETILFVLEDIRAGHFLPARPRLSTASYRDRRSHRLGSNQIGTLACISEANQSQLHPRQPHHTSSPSLARTSGPHTHTTTVTTTSPKSPYLRLRPPSKAPSDLMKSPKLPRFYFTMNSMLLLTCLLLFCNSVPIVSCSNLPFTAKVSRSIGDPPLPASPTFNRRSEPEPDSSSIFGPVVNEDNDNSMKCVYYNRTQCELHKTGCGNTYQVCNHNTGNESPSLCYALWRNSTDKGVAIEFKGCWLGHSKDCVPKDHTDGSPSQCVQTQSPNRNRKGLFFCCCSGKTCNENVKHVPLPPEPILAPTESPPSESNAAYRFHNHFTFYLLLGLGIFFLAGVVSVTVFLFGKCRHKPNSGDVPTTEPLLDGSNSTGGIGYVGLNPITLKEIRAQGKFGSVWLATDGRENMVAVKVFTVQDRASWQVEKDVFSLPQMKHKNILSYLGAERRGEGLDVEFWLITEYHPNGSLWDYLKSHTVNLKQLLTIIQGIGAGLTHLHEELPPTATEAGKPSVAHRDFKSKNVLLSTNFRASIADFGLAIVFHPNTLYGDAMGQVGTRRYMAPEVLEGAINFNRDSFLRIDMYSCGLVLWELMSRCCFGDITCGEYRLPFEEEVGTHPSLEDMQDVSLNNQNGTASYRVAFPSNNAAPAIANSNANPKNTFLMTAHPTNGPIPNVNSTSSNGSAFMLRETST